MRNLKRNKVCQKVAVTTAALGLLFSGMTLQETKSGLTQSVPSTVAVSAQQWISSLQTITPKTYTSTYVSWQALAEYSKYTLQWSKYSNFSSPTSLDVSGTSYTVLNQEGSTNYYYRVRPVGGLTSGWSTTKVVRTIDPTLSVNNISDVIAFDASGQVWNYGPAGSNTAFRRSIAPAGNTTPLSFHITDWDADGIQDILIKTSTGSGNLDLWKGRAGGGFTVVEIGYGGWNDFDIVVGDWKKTETYPSIVGIQKSTGDLFFYPNPTGGLHGPRVKVDFGWHDATLNLVDFDKDGNTDIIGKFAATGELKLYRTNGAGAIISETRKILGTNWNTMDSLRIAFGAEGAGTRGLVAREIATGDLYYYPIGNGTMGERRKFHSGFTGYKLSNN